MESTNIDNKINCFETITNKLINHIDEISANEIIDDDVSPPHKKGRFDDDDEEEKYDWVKPPTRRGPRLTESEIEELYKSSCVPRPEKPNHEMTDEELWLICKESCNGKVSIDTVKDTSLPVLKNYFKQLHESDGFDLDENPEIGLSICGLWKAKVCQKSHPEDYNTYMDLSQFAIDQTYNKDKKKDLKVLEVKSVNQSGCWTYLGSTCYMTFTASSAGEKKEKTFQAKVSVWLTYDMERKLMRDVLRCRLKFKD